MAKRMSVAEAARVFEDSKRAEQELKARLEVAGERLKEWFRESGKQDYRGRIGYSKASRTQLDTAAVKAELGERLPQFQKVVTYESLSVLKGA